MGGRGWMSRDRRKVKKLAKKVWENKWYREDITPENYMDICGGPCAFCHDAVKKRIKKEGDMSHRLCVPRICAFCFTPEFFCRFENNGKNLINVMHRCIAFNNRETFDKALKYVRSGIMALKKTGAVPEHFVKEIKDFLEDYYDFWN